MCYGIKESKVRTKNQWKGSWRLCLGRWEEGSLRKWYSNRFQTNKQYYFSGFCVVSGIFVFKCFICDLSFSLWIFAFVPNFVPPFLKRALQSYKHQSSLMIDPRLAALCKGGRETDLLTRSLGISPSSLSGVGGHWLSRSEVQSGGRKAQKQIHITELWADLGFGGPKYTQKRGRKQEDRYNTCRAKDILPDSAATSPDSTASLPTMADGAWLLQFILRVIAISNLPSSDTSFIFNMSETAET